MTIQFITDYLDSKIAKNKYFIECPVYEIRVVEDVKESEIDIFLSYAQTRLVNLGYNVYFTGAKYNWL